MQSYKVKGIEKMYSSDQVARAFLYCGNVNKTKLNILVYYAQAYWLAKNGEPLFPEDIVVGRARPCSFRYRS